MFPDSEKKRRGKHKRSGWSWKREEGEVLAEL